MDRKQVLIADDNATDRLVLKTFLSKLKIFDVLEAEDGQIALSKIQTTLDTSGSFELIFMDWKMPRVNGLKMLKALRSERRMRETHMIMLTSVSDEASVREALSEGANDYIVKPVEFEVLKSKIEILRSR
jgi:two-component system chemotaxis response regulator CheY